MSELARVRHTAGTFLVALGRPGDAEAALRDAVAVADQLGDRTPFDRQTRTVCRQSLVRFLRAYGRWADAAAVVRPAPDRSSPGHGGP